jgi:hypothetical protein
VLLVGRVTDKIVIKYLGCLAVVLLCLLELLGPDMNARLRIIGLTMLAGMLVFTAQFAIDNYHNDGPP